MSTDTITFFDEVDGNDSGATSAAPWKILVVDDEEEVFNVTQLAISGYEVFGKQCRLLYAPNSKEACKVLDGNPDIALVLLDIVMETDTAGINVIEYIRKRLNNPIMRIVIRTGQPGVIPEENMLQAIYMAHDVNQTVIAFIDKIVAECGKAKHEYTSCAIPAEMFEKMKEIVPSPLRSSAP